MKSIKQHAPAAPDVPKSLFLYRIGVLSFVCTISSISFMVLLSSQTEQMLVRSAS